jgi:hypothetical protein
MDLIVDRFHEKQCVPFLGAAANVSSKKHRYRGLKLGAGVADQLVAQIEFEGRDPRDLPRVALQYEFIKDRPDLIQKLRTILAEEKCAPSPLLQVLVKLPFSLIVSTNYDGLLERALQAANRPFQSIVQPLEGFSETKETNDWFDALEVYQGAKLYKIHGTFDDSHLTASAPENEVKGPPIPPVLITEDDYIQFLGIVNVPNVGIPKLITKCLVPSTLLFLGYSLEDWDFRTVFKGLIESLPTHQSRKSFAIQKSPSKFWVDFWEAKKVIIYDMDLYDFAEQLEKNYLARYPVKNQRNTKRR